ncbi:hypothetical protein NMY22_g13677 [Coprinellus aureogranulatus]|nr:hypothetical protein NMY22_g13677 [Coprinellus aureogranulatus]
MDRCLRIPELVRSICDGVDKASSLSVALTCRAFLDPGLDRIWQDIESLQPLISCLPGDIWKDDGERLLSLRRNLTPDDLQRYLELYAHRIKSLSPYSNSKKGHLNSGVLHVLQMVTDYRPGALSPRLQRFSWTSAHHWWRTRDYPVGSFDPYISLFVGESVESLDIQRPRDDPVYLGSVNLAARRLPHLKKLRVASQNGLAFTSWLMTSFAWQSLEKVDLDCASEETVAILAKLPNLRHIRLWDVEHASLVPLAGASPLQHAALTDFAFLRVLNVTSWELVSIKAMLQVLSPTNRIESVVSICPCPTDISDCQQTLSAIESFCNPYTLRSVKVADTCSCNWETEEQLDMYPDSCEADLDISGLSKFTNLQELVVRWQKSVQLSPREAALIPTWWPHIRHLDLCQQYPSLGRMPAIDHTHLLDLVRGCPLLRYLGLRFDTTQIPGKHQGPVETFQLEVLRAGESPIVSPSRVAGFLKRHFPRLEKLDFDYETVVQRETTILDKRWAAVAEALN